MNSENGVLADNEETVVSHAEEIEHCISLLDKGFIKAIKTSELGYIANQEVKKNILDYFKSRDSGPIEQENLAKGYDCIPLKFSNWTVSDFEEFGIRVVPGAIVRYGAYIGQSVVLMPCFVNIGAYIDDGTMIDTWATVGSCAQIGKNCHISGGAGIGGVLEPIGNTPVVIEDDVFIGARSEIAEGVVVGRGSVISMGVYIGASTPIVDYDTGERWTGIIPKESVVIPGSITNPTSGIGTYAAVVKKKVDGKTKEKIQLDSTFRK